MFGILEILSDYFKIPQINFEDVIDTNITTYLSIVYYLIKICPFSLPAPQGVHPRQFPDET